MNINEELSKIKEKVSRIIYETPRGITDEDLLSCFRHAWNQEVPDQQILIMKEEEYNREYRERLFFEEKLMTLSKYAANLQYAEALNSSVYFPVITRLVEAQTRPAYDKACHEMEKIVKSFSK